jgi:hypothetical protein
MTCEPDGTTSSAKPVPPMTENTDARARAIARAKPQVVVKRISCAHHGRSIAHAAHHTKLSSGRSRPRVGDQGRNLRAKTRIDREASRKMVRPKIIKMPPTAPTIDATGMNVSGPK